MRACAMGLRTTAIQTMPGRTRSSRKWPCPVTRRSSSLRSIREPMYRPISTEVSVSVPTACSSAAALPGSGPCAMFTLLKHRPDRAGSRRALDGLDDVGEPEALPQEVDDDQPRLDPGLAAHPIHGACDAPPRAATSIPSTGFAGAASGEPARHGERLAGG